VASFASSITKTGVEKTKQMHTEIKNRRKVTSLTARNKTPDNLQNGSLKNRKWVAFFKTEFDKERNRPEKRMKRSGTRMKVCDMRMRRSDTRMDVCDMRMRRSGTRMEVCDKEMKHSGTRMEVCGLKMGHSGTRIEECFPKRVDPQRRVLNQFKHKILAQ
jgi:hypothetical protein